MTFPRTVRREVTPTKDRSTVLRGFDFEAISISIASPEEILAWSYGEVLKPETINYRTQKPERDGLFDEKIFGPVKDFECYCGKYRKIRFEGVICDKCGVEVTKSVVRRERMGHLDLAAPAAHIWYVRGVPSVLSLLLDISVNDLEKVIYFAAYLILEVSEELRESSLHELEREYEELRKEEEAKAGSDLSARLAVLEAAYKEERGELTNLKTHQTISESRYQAISLKYGSLIRVGIGAEAISELLERIVVSETIAHIRGAIAQETPPNRRRLLRKLNLLSAFERAHIQPSWLIMKRLPVIPPDLRPMVQLDGGRFAASDLNDLYRRVLNRNNRLKRLLATGAPEVITRNEKRMLQEAVDSLIDNSAARGRAVTAVGNRRKLRSLSDMLRGKQGRFRQNLLGKRVDYSGRSVIVIGPELRLHQCGLPKVMAMELFKPFVIGRLIRDGFVHNVKNATKLIEQAEPFVWDILEDITRNHYVLLNRAPTLHRLGIQAFQPVLIEGKAIQVHPLVCSAFNADFDGDQMAVHVPLSSAAQWEASELMRSSYNLLKPASGEPIVSPRLDMVWGLYYLTSEEPGTVGEGRIFEAETAARAAFEFGKLHLRAPITCRIKKASPEAAGGSVRTTLGQIILNEALPEDFPFETSALDHRGVRRLVSRILDRSGKLITAEVADKLKDLGFWAAEESGMTFSVSDLKVPERKAELLKDANSELSEIEKQFSRGLISSLERSEKTISLWKRVDTALKEAMVKGYDVHNPIITMVKSGARGSVSQLAQLSGMKGLMINPAGEIIEIPVVSNHKEGLKEYEYFISTHGSRKGRIDTALRTSVAGYLTRRLIDVAQDIFITAEDCGTTEGATVSLSQDPEQVLSRLHGRVLLKSVGKLQPGTLLDQVTIGKVMKSGVATVTIRTLLNCIQSQGVCQRCYGMDLASGNLVELGAVVGVVAAQAIGEPGTQLTMRTFHTGGVVGAGEDITTGLPRVEELFEARTPRTPAIMAESAGKVRLIESPSRLIQIAAKERAEDRFEIGEGYKILVKHGTKVRGKQALASSQDGSIRAPYAGLVTVKGRVITLKGKESQLLSYEIPAYLSIRVTEGEAIEAGTLLTDGHLDVQRALEYLNESTVARYIIEQVQAVYAAQGQTIADKHIECIVRQMFSKVRITEAHDSAHLPGEIIDRRVVLRLNKERKEAGKKPIEYEQLILGITKVALRADSFLAAASFQETTSVLIQAASRGAVDKLRGLKENVIIGKLIPAGTGLPGRRRVPEVISP